MTRQIKCVVKCEDTHTNRPDSHIVINLRRLQSNISRAQGFPSQAAMKPSHETILETEPSNPMPNICHETGHETRHVSAGMKPYETGMKPR